ncbi:DegT/DnrJ/EryC1/StrS family aminotransferase [Alphaproteobacteria bacterium]|nr:DegT/DnrJ/EryC1/StrS family aminotransferase [Alphaproteobacteria bacterium]
MPGYELIDHEERAAVLDIFDSSGGVLFAHGFDKLRNGRYRVREFEQKFAAKMNANYSLAVSSGSAALKVALSALNVGFGDEVIIPSFTFIATAEAVIEVGATPVVADINQTFNLDPIDVKGKITPKTKAIIAVHMMGCAADILALKKIADDHSLRLIEDVAQCCGAKIGDVYLGQHGDVGCFSFDFGKTITCGEGGMVTFKREEDFVRGRAFHDHGHEYSDPNRANDPAILQGFNYRMTEVQAAIGMVQLSKLDRIVNAQKDNKARLKEKINNLDFSFRTIVADSGDIGDSLIVLISNKTDPRVLAELIKDHALPVKNIPDAIRWHYAGFWQHLLGKKAQKNYHKTDIYLLNSIAVPINVFSSEEVEERVFRFFSALKAS